MFKKVIIRAVALAAFSTSVIWLVTTGQWPALVATFTSGGVLLKLILFPIS